MFALMTLPQQMMLMSMQATQTFFVRYVEASQRLMTQGRETVETAAEEVSEASEAVNWTAQDALRRAGERDAGATPV
jgi:hypothetical protein